MFSPVRRPLLQALIASALLHAVLLLSVAVPLPVRLATSGQALSVVVKEAERPLEQRAPASVVATAPAIPALAPEARAGASRKPPARKPAARLARRDPPAHFATAAPVSVADAAPAEAPAVSSLPTPAGAGPAASSAGGQLQGGGNAAASTASPRDGVKGDDVRQFRMSLARAARRFKRYPALARERGWEGTADVALDLHAHSPVPAVAVVQSSGHGVLDEQARAMVSEAARVTALPEGLKGRDLRVVLPVKFSLEGDG